MPALTSSILRSLIADLDMWPVFVETGTYYGQSIFAMEPLFDELHTVELSENLWRNSSQNYSGTKIRFHLGDSVAVLGELLPSLCLPTVFFLDGHWSCGETARGNVDVPLLGELDIICRCFRPPALVIIDDLRLFGQGPHSGEAVDWTAISGDHVRKITENRLGVLSEDRLNDKLVLRLDGL